MHASWIVCLAAAGAAQEADSPYLKAAAAYADAMIEKGRDAYGREHTPLFAAALDRRTMRLGTLKDFGPIPGVRDKDRSVSGANPQQDMALYALLYRLAERPGQERYAKAADDALAYFFSRAQSAKTGLMAWGEHLYWDFHLDARAEVWDVHEANAEWPFWDVCYRAAPDASWRYALGLWRHQVADHKTGDFSRHARWSEHGPETGADFPRYAGQMIATWADAYARPANAERPERAELRTAVTVILGRMEVSMAGTPTGLLPGIRDQDHVWPHSNLELARCLWKSAPLLDAELGRRLRDFARRLDESFLAAPHKVAAPNRKYGFSVRLDKTSGEPIRSKRGPSHTRPWAAGYGVLPTAEIANLCVERHAQLADAEPALAARFRALILEAADTYLEVDLEGDDPEAPHKPQALAAAIDLLLSARRLSGEKKYLDRAGHFGRAAMAMFLGDGLPLPRASQRHDHYEALTGGPELMLSLFRLHEAEAP